MSCPLCQQRKPRRYCPALRQTICSICCGTKRLVEIDCPSECPHLNAAREYPAAVVKRQQERDVAALMPALERLTERQHQLFFLFQTVIARHQPEGFVRLSDDDVAEAAGALAATLETAARGLIYEHVPPTKPAQRLMAELTTMLAEIREHVRVHDSEAAATLRAIERGARETRLRAEGGDTAYLQLTARLLQVFRGAAARTRVIDGPPPGGSIILP